MYTTTYILYKVELADYYDYYYSTLTQLLEDEGLARPTRPKASSSIFREGVGVIMYRRKPGSMKETYKLT
jgi:hypothetical protein